MNSRVSQAFQDAKIMNQNNHTAIQSKNKQTTIYVACDNSLLKDVFRIKLATLKNNVGKQKRYNVRKL